MCRAAGPCEFKPGRATRSVGFVEPEDHAVSILLAFEGAEDERQASAPDE